MDFSIFRRSLKDRYLSVIFGGPAAKYPTNDDEQEISDIEEEKEIDPETIPAGQRVREEIIDGFEWN